MGKKKEIGWQELVHEEKREIKKLADWKKNSGEIVGKREKKGIGWFEPA